MEKALNPPELLELVQKNSPLVHHITNVVTIAGCADVTIAIGGSPVMADSVDEAADMVKLAQALVLNMGTLHRDSVEAMLLAGRAARQRGVPIVFDPVGAGATPFRKATALRIMTELKPDIVKGNRSEIGLLAGGDQPQKGVDADQASLGNDWQPAAKVCLAAARRWQTVIAATGPIDVLSNGQQTLAIGGGTPLLGRITGSGCMLASLIGCFAAVTADRLLAAATGLLVMNKAGEVAAAACGERPGTGDFRRELMNAVSRFEAQWFDWSARVQYVT